MNTLRLSALAASAFVACAAPDDLFVPLEPGTRSLIVVLDRLGELRLSAVDLEDGRRVLLREEGDFELTLLGYAVPLAALGLEPGLLTIATGDRWGIPLPAPRDGRSAAVRDRRLSAWTPLERLPEALAELRVESPDAQVCLEAGGCFSVSPGHTERVCVRPCPEPPAPAPPEAPRPPVFLPCPDGWEEVERAGVAVCEPWPRGRARCPQGEVHLPGEPGCTPVGARCPEGRFAAELPSDREVRFVDPAAPAGGDGGSAAPFADLGVAFAAAPEVRVFALSAGTHHLPAIELPDGTALLGACAERTHLVPQAARLEVPARALALSDLTLLGGALNLDRGTLALRGVELTEGAQLWAVSSQVTARGLAIRGMPGTSPSGFAAGTVADLEGLVVDGPGIQAFGGGTRVAIRRASFTGSWWTDLYVTEGAALELSGAALEGADAHAVLVQGGAQARLSDVVIRDGGPGVTVDGGGRLEAHRLLLDARSTYGLSAYLGRLAASDLVVLGTQSDAVRASGLAIQAAGEVRLERARLVDNRTFGVAAFNDGTRCELIDVHIAEVHAREHDRLQGVGVFAIEGPEVRLERVHIARARGHGIRADGTSTRVTGADVEVVDTRPREATGAYGRGLEAAQGATVDLRRVRFARNLNLAAYALDAGTTLRMEDVYLGETRESACFEFSCNVGLADGLSVALLASAVVTRFAIAANAVYGVRVTNNSPLTLRDGRISGNGIGMQVVSAGFDFRSIADGVLFSDNGENFALLAP